MGTGYRVCNVYGWYIFSNNNLVKMNKKDLDEKIENVFDFAVETMSKNGSFISMCEIIFEEVEGVKNSILFGFGDEESMNKRFLLYKGLGNVFGLLKYFNRIKNVQCFIMTSEAWMTKIDKDKYPNGNFPLPSQLPREQRAEVLITMAQTTEGLQKTKCKEITRTKALNGKVFISLNDMTQPEGFKEQKILSADDFFNSYNTNAERLKPLGDLNILEMYKEKDLAVLLDKMISDLVRLVCPEGKLVNIKK